MALRTPDGSVKDISLDGQCTELTPFGATLFVHCPGTKPSLRVPYPPGAPPLPEPPGEASTVVADTGGRWLFASTRVAGSALMRFDGSMANLSERFWNAAHGAG